MRLIYTALDFSATQILTRTLSYLDKCSVENGSLEAYSNSTLPIAAVPVSDSTSRCLDSVLLAFLGPITISKVLRQPQSSLGLIASAKGLHQPLKYLDTMSLDNTHTEPFLTTLSPKCGAGFTLTKATSTTTCSVFPLSLARTAFLAVHDQKRK